jgi:hypothetical protein
VAVPYRTPAVARVGVLNTLLQRQHFGIERYIAIARNLRFFADASCSRSLGDCVEPNSDKLKLALAALGRDRQPCRHELQYHRVT